MLASKVDLLQISLSRGDITRETESVRGAHWAARRGENDPAEQTCHPPDPDRHEDRFVNTATNNRATSFAREIQILRDLRHQNIHNPLKRSE